MLLACWYDTYTTIMKCLGIGEQAAVLRPVYAVGMAATGLIDPVFPMVVKWICDP